MDTTKNVSDLLEQIQQNLQCAICLEILTNPVSTKCDHNFCSFCISTFLNTKRSVPCPLCKTSLTKRSFQSRSKLNLIIEGVKRLITAFEEDTGVTACTPNKAICAIPTSSPVTRSSGRKCNSSNKKNSAETSGSKSIPSKSTEKETAKDAKPNSSNSLSLTEESAVFELENLLSATHQMVVGKHRSSCATGKVTNCDDSTTTTTNETEGELLIDIPSDKADDKSKRSKSSSRKALLQYLEEGPISHPDKHGQCGDSSVASIERCGKTQRKPSRRQSIESRNAESKEKDLGGGADVGNKSNSLETPQEAGRSRLRRSCSARKQYSLDEECSSNLGNTFPSDEGKRIIQCGQGLSAEKEIESKGVFLGIQSEAQDLNSMAEGQVDVLFGRARSDRREGTHATDKLNTSVDVGSETARTTRSSSRSKARKEEKKMDGSKDNVLKLALEQKGGIGTSVNTSSPLSVCSTQQLQKPIQPVSRTYSKKMKGAFKEDGKLSNWSETLTRHDKPHDSGRKQEAEHNQLLSLKENTCQPNCHEEDKSHESSDNSPKVIQIVEDRIEVSVKDIELIRNSVSDKICLSVLQRKTIFKSRNPNTEPFVERAQMSPDVLENSDPYDFKGDGTPVVKRRKKTAATTRGNARGKAAAVKIPLNVSVSTLIGLKKNTAWSPTEMKREKEEGRNNSSILQVPSSKKVHFAELDTSPSITRGERKVPIAVQTKDTDTANNVEANAERQFLHRKTSSTTPPPVTMSDSSTSLEMNDDMAELDLCTDGASEEGNGVQANAGVCVKGVPEGDEVSLEGKVLEGEKFIDVDRAETENCVNSKNFSDKTSTMASQTVNLTKRRRQRVKKKAVKPEVCEMEIEKMKSKINEAEEYEFMFSTQEACQRIEKEQEMRQKLIQTAFGFEESQMDAGSSTPADLEKLSENCDNFSHPQEPSINILSARLRSKVDVQVTLKNHEKSSNVEDKKMSANVREDQEKGRISNVNHGNKNSSSSANGKASRNLFTAFTAADLKDKKDVEEGEGAGTQLEYLELKKSMNTAHGADPNSFASLINAHGKASGEEALEVEKAISRKDNDNDRLENYGEMITLTENKIVGKPETGHPKDPFSLMKVKFTSRKDKQMSNFARPNLCVMTAFDPQKHTASGVESLSQRMGGSVTLYATPGIGKDGGKGDCLRGKQPFLSPSVSMQTGAMDGDVVSPSLSLKNSKTKMSLNVKTDSVQGCSALENGTRHNRSHCGENFLSLKYPSLDGNDQNLSVNIHEKEHAERMDVKTVGTTSVKISDDGAPSGTVIVKDTCMDEWDDETAILSSHCHPMTIPDTELTDSELCQDQKCERNDSIQKSCSHSDESVSPSGGCSQSEQISSTYVVSKCGQDVKALGENEEKITADVDGSEDVVMVPSGDSESELFTPTDISQSILLQHSSKRVRGLSRKLMSVREAIESPATLPDSYKCDTLNRRCASPKCYDLPDLQSIPDSTQFAPLTPMPCMGRSSLRKNSGKKTNLSASEQNTSIMTTTTSKRNFSKIPQSAPDRLNFSGSDDEYDSVLIRRQDKRNCLSLDSKPLEPVVFGAAVKFDQATGFSSHTNQQSNKEEKLEENENVGEYHELEESREEKEGVQIERDFEIPSIVEYEDTPDTDNMVDVEYEDGPGTDKVELPLKVEVTPVGKFRHIDSQGRVVVNTNMDSEGEDNLVTLPKTDVESYSCEGVDKNNGPEESVNSETQEQNGDSEQADVTITSTPTNLGRVVEPDCGNAGDVRQEVDVQSCTSTSSCVPESDEVVAASDNTPKKKGKRGLARKSNPIHQKLLSSQLKSRLSPKAKAAILKEFCQTKTDSDTDKISDNKMDVDKINDLKTVTNDVLANFVDTSENVLEEVKESHHSEVSTIPNSCGSSQLVQVESHGVATIEDKMCNETSKTDTDDTLSIVRERSMGGGCKKKSTNGDNIYSPLDEDKKRLEEELFGQGGDDEESQSELEDIHFDLDLSPCDQDGQEPADTQHHTTGAVCNSHSDGILAHDQSLQSDPKSTPSHPGKLSKTLGVAGASIDNNKLRKDAEFQTGQSHSGPGWGEKSASFNDKDEDRRRNVPSKDKRTDDDVREGFEEVDNESELDKSLDCQPLTSSLLDHADSPPTGSLPPDTLDQSSISEDEDVMTISEDEDVEMTDYNKDRDEMREDNYNVAVPESESAVDCDDDSSKDAQVLSASNENDEIIMPSKIRKRRRISSDSDDDTDNGNDHGSNSENNYTYTSSSAFSSQSEILTTQQREALEKDVADLQHKVAKYEAVLKGGTGDPLQTPQIKIITVEDSPLYDDERREEDDDDNKSVDDDVVEESDEDLFIMAPSPSPPEKPKPRPLPVSSRPVLAAESGIALKKNDLVKRFQSPGGSLHKRRQLLEFSHASVEVKNETATEELASKEKFAKEEPGLSKAEEEIVNSEHGGRRSPVLHSQGSKSVFLSRQGKAERSSFSTGLPCVLVTSGISRQEMQVVQEATRLFPNVKYSPRFGPGVAVTHVIMKTVMDGELVCDRTLKYFKGVSQGLWLVSAQWLVKSLQAGHLLAEADYEIRGDTSGGPTTFGPRKARLSKDKLFADYSFACVGNSPELPRESLHELVSQCGAVVVEDVITLPSADRGKKIIIRCADTALTPIEHTMLRGLFESTGMVSVKRDWILDCISSYQICPLGGYLLTGGSP